MATVMIILALVVAGLLCIAGIVVSCIGFSGTWLVALAAVLTVIATPGAFPGWWTVVIFVLVAAAVEGVEAIAGYLGVRKQGGSHMAGFMAVVGGLAGMVLGSFMPVPVFGSLIGMVAGGFLLVFAYERYRLKKSEPAVRVAWGSVVARLLVMLLKTAVALGMTIVLVIGVIRAL